MLVMTENKVYIASAPARPLPYLPTEPGVDESPVQHFLEDRGRHTGC